MSYMSDKQFNPERRIYDHSSYTRFRPLTSTFHNEQFKMRNSFQISAKENEEIESELFRIESRLLKGTSKHLKSVIEKSRLVRTSNEAAEKIAQNAKESIKKREEKSLNDYVEKYMK